MNKVVEQKHVKITSANQGLDIENKKLGQKNEDPNRELTKESPEKTQK